MSVNEKMTAINDNIRSKTGKTGLLTLDDMASGVNEVYEKGYTQSEIDVWNLFTENCKANKDYTKRFEGWNTDFNPPFKLNLMTKYPLFAQLFYNAHGITKLRASDIFFGGEEYAPSESSSYVTAYTSSQNCGFRSAFYYCNNLTEIEDVGFTGASYCSAFTGCSSLHTIAKLHSLKKTKQDDGFYNCKALQNISFTGVIGTNIGFTYSPLLTLDSLKNIIEHLYDFAGNGETTSVRISLSSASKQLLEAEGATSPNGNTWIEYIADKGWTLK